MFSLTSGFPLERQNSATSIANFSNFLVACAEVKLSKLNLITLRFNKFHFESSSTKAYLSTFISIALTP